MWPLKLFLVTLSVLLVHSNGASCDTIDSEVIEAIPPEVSTESEVPLDQTVTGSEPVSYKGGQLWRLSYKDQQSKSIVSKLQKKYKTSMWNLQMANSSNAYIDMFVAPAVVDEAKDFMNKQQVPYEVIMNDVQEAIDNENPPLDETDLWQNRDGKENHFFLINCYCTPLCSMNYNLILPLSLPFVIFPAV